MAKRVLVFTGGDRVDPAVIDVDALRADFVIAADSGVDLARSANVVPDVVIGDFDSASAKSVEWARRQGSKLDSHPKDKDQTDFEMALRLAANQEADEIVVIGGGGRRVDHLLANLTALALALALPAQAATRVRAVIGEARLDVVGPLAPLDAAGEPGQLLSLIPIGGDAEGVRTTGLRFPLSSETLAAGTSRGMSNEFTSTRCTVVLTRGTLLAIFPTPFESPTPHERSQR